ncbi:ice-binding family protein [Marinobacter sp.]|uniref:ice-binding family protein n=1 Tax=Marinobacter sp. TaxID=50741 RepID=UPI00384BA185
MGILSKYSRSIMTFSIALMSVSLVACSDSNNGSSIVSEETPVPIASLAVTSTGPASDAVGVATNTLVTATFSEAISAGTLDSSSFTVGVTGGSAMTGNVTLDTATNTGIFKAAGGAFSDSTAYTAVITTAVESADGKTLPSNYEWSFTTGAAADITPPEVTSTDPADAATGVAINRNITANFSEAMNVATINSSTFTVTDNNTDPVRGTVEVIGTTAVFNPENDLATGTEYTATLTTEVKDLAANPLAANFVWSFVTGSSVAQGPAPVVLGTAGDYVILAKTGISTTGTTAITGDIAVSPAAESFITGFSLTRDATDTFSTSSPSSLVTGKVFAANMASPTPSMLTTAVSDMETAYTDAAGRSNPDATELGAGNISGMNLTPGLYKWSSGLLITTNVTLTGNANDVWILQIAGDLTVSNGVIVKLEGGAVAKNVFWQVGGKTTFGTTSDVKGIFLSKTKIVLETEATLNGRALSQTAVTLDANAVTQPE